MWGHWGDSAAKALRRETEAGPSARPWEWQRSTNSMLSPRTGRRRHQTVLDPCRERTRTLMSNHWRDGERQTLMPNPCSCGWKQTPVSTPGSDRETNSDVMPVWDHRDKLQYQTLATGEKQNPMPSHHGGGGDKLQCQTLAAAERDRFPHRPAVACGDRHILALDPRISGDTNSIVRPCTGRGAKRRKTLGDDLHPSQRQRDKGQH